MLAVTYLNGKVLFFLFIFISCISSSMMKAEVSEVIPTFGYLAL